MKTGMMVRSAMLAGLVTIAPNFAQAQWPAADAGAAAQPGSALSITQAQLLQPEGLNRMLRAGGAAKPLVLQVGSHVLFAQAHIPGAEYAGAGSQPSGLEILRNRVVSLPRNTLIVLYCGCCPWNRCPNLGPAFQKLREMGFTNVKALYLEDNFGTNWVDKGYPVEQGR